MRHSDTTTTTVPEHTAVKIPRRTVKPVPQTHWIAERMREVSVPTDLAMRKLKIDHSQWSRLHRGLRRIKAHEVPIVAELFGVSVDEIMFRFGLTETPSQVPIVGAFDADGVLVRVAHISEHVSRLPGRHAEAAARVVSKHFLINGSVVHWQAPVVGLEAVKLFGHLSLATLADGREICGVVEMTKGQCTLKWLGGGGKAIAIDIPKSLAPVLAIILPVD